MYHIEIKEENIESAIIGYWRSGATILEMKYLTDISEWKIFEMIEKRQLAIKRIALKPQISKTIEPELIDENALFDQDNYQFF